MTWELKDSQKSYFVWRQVRNNKADVYREDWVKDHLVFLFLLWVFSLGFICIIVNTNNLHVLLSKNQAHIQLHLNINI